MTGRAAARTVTVTEIAAARGLSLNTVHFHRGHLPGFPSPVGRRPPAGRRGQPELEYDATAVDAFYSAKEAAHPQARPGPHRPPGSWDPEERLANRTAAARLGVADSTFRAFPAMYREDAANPFPARGSDGRYRWGDLEDWDERRPGSGRRDALPRRPRQADDAPASVSPDHAQDQPHDRTGTPAGPGTARARRPRRRKGPGAGIQPV